MRDTDVNPREAGTPPLPLRRRRATLAICVVAMLLGLVSAMTLRPGTAVRDMLPQRSAASVALDRVLTQFRLMDDLVVLASVEPGEGNPSEKLVAFAEDLRAGLQHHPDVESVRFREESLPRSLAQDVLLPQLWWRLNDAQRAAVTQRLQPSAMQQRFRHHAAMLVAPGARPDAWLDNVRNDPLGLIPLLEEHGDADGVTLDAWVAPMNEEDELPGLMLSDDGRSLLVAIAGNRPANDLPYTHRLVAHVKQTAESLRPDGVDLGHTGPYAIADFSANATKHDMIVSMVVSMVLLSLLFLVVYRDFRTLPAILATVNGGGLVAFGLYAAGGGQLSPVTAVCGAVLAGLGIDYGIHLITKANDRSPGSLTTALRTTGPVLLAACVTSALGFGVVAAAGVRALTEFAVLGVLGLFATLGMTLLFLPAVLLRRVPDDEGGAARAATSPTRLARSVVERITARPHRWLFAWAVMLGMAFGAVTVGHDGPWLRFAGDLEAMHAVPNPPLEAQAVMTDAFGRRASVMLVHVTGPDADTLLERSRAVEAGLRELSQDEPRIATVNGLGALLASASAEAFPPEADVTLAAFDAAVESSPLNPEAFAGFRDVLSRVLRPSDTPSWDALREHAAAVGPLLPRVFFDGAEATEALVVAELASPWELMDDRASLLSGFAAAVAAVEGATLTGLAVIGAEMQGELSAVVNRLVLLAGIAVVVWLAVFFRNPWEVIAALCPAAAGLLVLVAAISVGGIELHAVNLIALPLTLGLGVDDGIFLVAAARRVRRAKQTVADLRRELGVTSHAIMMTSITTLLAFGSLSFTNTPAVQSLGVLSAVGVATCLGASLFGLVPALVMVHSRRAWRPKRRR